MKTSHVCSQLCLALLLFAAAARSTYAADQAAISGPSDLAAALIVAYGDYVKVTSQDALPLTAIQFPKRFETVSVARDGDDAVVKFSPPFREYTTGGSVVYMIDLKDLTIKQRIFGR